MKDSMFAAPPQPWFDDRAYRLSARLQALAAAHHDETDLFWRLFDFYNHLMLRAERGEAAAARDQAQTAVVVFGRLGLGMFEAMFLEAIARLALQEHDLLGGVEAMERMSNLATADQAAEVLELAEDVWNSVRGDYRLELSGPVLAGVSRVYARLGETELRVKAILEAASLYAHNGAREPAQAALREALGVAKASGSKPLVARVLLETTVVGYDGRDAAAGLAAADEALAIYGELSEAPPSRLLANRATLLMQTGRFEEAGAIYESLLDAEPAERFALLPNLASVRRRQGRLHEAMAYIEQARVARPQGDAGESDLELELIAAAIASDAGDAGTLRSALAAACQVLDAGLGSIFRLHHRRGFRERYLNRIEGLMANLPAQGVTADLVPLLATVYSGLVADWMAVQAWVAGLDPAGQSTAAVRSAMEAVRASGAPFLPRRAETHDDAWSPNLEGRAWDALGLAVDEALGAGLRPPHRGLDLLAIQGTLETRLEEGWAIIAPTFTGKRAFFWVMTSAGYTRLSVYVDAVLAFFGARLSFAAGSASRADFREALSEYIARLSGVLNPALSRLPATCPGILLLQDLFDAVPLNAVVLGIEDLRRRMAEGRFEVRTAPVLYPGEPGEALCDPAIVAVVDLDDDLVLAKPEGTVLAKAFGQPAPATFDAADEVGLLAALETADLLLVSTHGGSISRYADPASASLGVFADPHAVRVATIQERFPALPYQLVLLNACHAGAVAPPRVVNGLRTHDSAGYPALLLMNRRSTVGAPGWPIYDFVSLLHVALVGEALAGGLPPGRALSQASARLAQMTRRELVGLLDAMPAEPAIRRAADSFRAGAPNDLVFQDPYVYGAFAAYALV
jgi:tetratricopeptide (TPR) repeat protein